MLPGIVEDLEVLSNSLKFAMFIIELFTLSFSLFLLVFLYDVPVSLYHWPEQSKGLAITSEGATCVFLDGYKNSDGSPMPLIVRKSDGGFLYATTDLAAIKQRVEKVHYIKSFCTLL